MKHELIEFNVAEHRPEHIVEYLYALVNFFGMNMKIFITKEAIVDFERKGFWVNDMGSYSHVLMAHGEKQVDIIFKTDNLFVAAVEPKNNSEYMLFNYNSVLETPKSVSLFIYFEKA